VTHTFLGASLSAVGLRRTTPLATATLVLAVNAPDVDLIAQAWGPYTALAWRRGVTHGIPALVLLPFLTLGVVLAWDRWIRRRGRPELEPARGRAVLGLAFLGVWTHPVLDWLNTYGIRWLMPLDPRWSYGDAVFVVDPWIWLLLGGAVFLVHSRSVPARLLWALLALGMSLLVLATGLVPLWGQLLWLTGTGGWILLRMRLGERATGAEGGRVVRWALAGATAYTLFMVVQTPLAERSVLAAAADLGVGPVEDVMVGPIPARPLRRQVILQTPEAYYRGSFDWTAAPRTTLDRSPLERIPTDPVIEAAEAHPEARRYLVWSRYPWHRVVPDGDGWRVEIRDVRYLGRMDVTGLAGVTVRVGPEGTHRGGSRTAPGDAGEPPPASSRAPRGGG
jgi:inner membrane protein